MVLRHRQSNLPLTYAELTFMISVLYYPGFYFHCAGTKFFPFMLSCSGASIDGEAFFYLYLPASPSRICFGRAWPAIEFCHSAAEIKSKLHYLPFKIQFSNFQIFPLVPVKPLRGKMIKHTSSSTILYAQRAISNVPCAP